MEMLCTFRELMRDLSHPEPQISEKNLPDLSGKVYIITGASSGIGFETAKLLVRGGAKVWIIGRTPARLEKSLESLRSEFPSAKVEGLIANYSDLSTVAPAISKFLTAEKELHGIVHNAGRMWDGSELSDTGIEDILLTNVLGGFLVQRLLDDIMIKTAKSTPPNSVRIIWVSSSVHNLSPGNGGLHWEDLNNPPNGRSTYGIYGQSKAFNIYQAIQWAKHHEGSGIISVSIHPGIIVSDIQRVSGERKKPGRMFRPTVYGGYAQISVLLSPTVTTANNGAYYIPMDTPGRIRPDVLKAANGPDGEKAWKWMTDKTSNYTAAQPVVNL